MLGLQGLNRGIRAVETSMGGVSAKTLLVFRAARTSDPLDAESRRQGAGPCAGKKVSEYSGRGLTSAQNCGETIADRRPQTADRRPQTADRRPQTADRRPQTADRRPQTADRRPQTADRRPQTADRRPQTADRRPQTADRRPQTADRRPQTFTPNARI